MGRKESNQTNKVQDFGNLEFSPMCTTSHTDRGGGGVGGWDINFQNMFSYDLL